MIILVLAPWVYAIVLWILWSFVTILEPAGMKSKTLKQIEDISSPCIYIINVKRQNVAYADVYENMKNAG